MDHNEWSERHNRTHQEWIAYTTANPPRPAGALSFRAIGVLGLLCAAIGLAYVVAFSVLTGGR